MVLFDPQVFQEQDRCCGEDPIIPLVCRVVELLTWKKQGKYGSKEKATYSFTEVQLMVILVD